jgi:hypothetical protein
MALPARFPRAGTKKVGKKLDKLRGGGGIIRGSFGQGETAMPRTQETETMGAKRTTSAES